MTESEGVIQYQLEHRPGELPEEADYNGLFRWFRRCRDHELLGQDPARYDGYAYGNISIRSGTGFVISGTQTGGKQTLTRQDLAFVETFDSRANCLQSRGPCKPSSEAMTHGDVYGALPGVNAVIHVHSPALWRRAAALELPSTPAKVGYGTPAMAIAVTGLLTQHQSAGLISMGGHEDGIIAYAATMDEAGRRLLDALERAEQLADGLPACCKKGSGIRA